MFLAHLGTDTFPVVTHQYSISALYQQGKGLCIVRMVSRKTRDKRMQRQSSDNVGTLELLQLY